MPKADLTAPLLAATLLLPGSPQARDYFEPFLSFMTSTDGISIICDGPFLRTSGCVPLARVNHQEFYRAYNTVFQQAVRGSARHLPILTVKRREAIFHSL